MLSKYMTIIAGFMLLLGSSSAWSQVTASRTLPSATLAPGAIYSTDIMVDVDEASAPVAVIVVETLPAGWLPSNAVPNYASFDASSGEIKWLLGTDTTLADVTINYDTTIPAASASMGFSVNGSLKFTSGTMNLERVVAGDSSVTVGSTADCWTLAVAGGTVSTTENCTNGYTGGTVVSISANAPAANMVFDAWTGDLSTVASVNSATTTITMDANKTLTATYKASSGTTCTSAPPPVQNVTATTTLADRVTLTWDASAGATSYEVFQDFSPNFEFAISLGTTSQTTFDDVGVFGSFPGSGCTGTDLLAEPYFYWIVAKNDCGDSAPSAVARGNAAKRSGSVSKVFDWIKRSLLGDVTILSMSGMTLFSMERFMRKQ